ncbi:MAG: nitroreductase family protein [Candidatus Micrarchaeia archaeon]
MEFFELLKKRRSVRKFEKKDIEERKIKEILEAMNTAPSAGDLQAYKVFIIKDEKIKERLAKAAYGQYFISEAPVVFVFFANPKESGRKYGKRGEELYCIQDSTIACTYAQLAAENLGLSSVWVGAFDDEEVKEIIGTNLRPIAILPIGYPSEKPTKTPRKRIDEITEFIQ